MHHIDLQKIVPFEGRGQKEEDEDKLSLLVDQLELRCGRRRRRTRRKSWGTGGGKESRLRETRPAVFYGLTNRDIGQIRL